MLIYLKRNLSSYDTVIVTSHYRFNEKNLPELTTDSFSDGGWVKYSFSYDVNGKLTEEIIKGSRDSSVMGRRWFLYNEKGILIEEYEYRELAEVMAENYFKKKLPERNGNEKFTMKSVYTLNEKAQRICDSSFYPSREYYGKYTFKYDNEGNVIEFKKYDKKDSLLHSYPFMDPIYESHQPETPKINDGNSELIESSHYSPEHAGDIKSGNYYTFKVDSAGNWIEMVEFKNKIPVCISERIIEYYEK
ncbi:MAG: hypothetical protein IAF38_10395 [Bacteroidia bacterium]|nr:hypothetical protein [Bacteroidia bacterium]